MAVTYASLVEETPIILSAQNQTMLGTAMPSIIRRAEDEVIQRLDRDAFRVRLQTPYAVGPGAATFDLTSEPQRVLEIRTVSATFSLQTVALSRRDVAYLRQLFSDLQGDPRHYAEDDAPSVYRVFPEPDTTWTLQITADIEPLRLSDSNQSTLLTINQPRVIEMAVFKHAAIFMRNPNDEARYGQQFEDALKSENDRYERRRSDETSRTGRDTASLTT